MQLTLPTCVIPGCLNPVGDPGDVCGECQRAFGGMLSPTGVRLTQREIDERDEAVAAAYAQMREVK